MALKRSLNSGEGGNGCNKSVSDQKDVEIMVGAMAGDSTAVYYMW